MKIAKRRRILVLFVMALAVLGMIMAFVLTAYAAPDTTGMGIGAAAAGIDEAKDGIFEKLVGLLGSRSSTLQITALLTILSVAPSILLMLTSFTRIIIVLSFTRNALGMQQMPPNQVLVGLALILTFFVMTPVVDEIKTEAYDPYVAQEIEIDEAVDNAMKPIRSFMLRQTFKEDLNVFAGMADIAEISSYEELPTRVLLPAFITSEIKRGFMIGFFIYIPFIVVDMIVASTLMSMGMMMLPPVVISLPFKVLLFVAVDGWMLTVKTLVAGFS